jgi:hypothetical protein
MTNTDFAKYDPVFRKACEIGKVKPTARQASKWRNRRGSARKFVGSATAWCKKYNWV